MSYQAGRLYHRGHTWVQVESPERARVGLDLFAARISGVTKSGLFVRLIETGADGFVPAATLGRWAHRAAVALLLGLVLITPFRVAYATRHANLEHIGVGLSQWQASADGVRYRWAGGRSSFYAPSSARRISFLLRRGPGAPAQIEVRVFLDGREADRVVLGADDGWKPVLLLPGRTVVAAFSRIDLQVCLPGTDSGRWALSQTAPEMSAPPESCTGSPVSRCRTVPSVRARQTS